ncbi:MAG: retropepsin-like domain-containing protein [Deltaproteobacteria bacterium]|nr:retropepsin-like domain-containing protein [Deltaproteobacteria bacterium]
MRRLLLPLLLAVGCAAGKPAPEMQQPEPGPPPPFAAALDGGQFEAAGEWIHRLQERGELVASLLARLRLGERRHDAALLRLLAGDPRIELLLARAEWKDELARALFWTVGPAEALPFYESLCASGNTESCALSSLTRLASRRPREVSGERRARVELLTRIPLPMVPLSVNGGPPADFIVDSGASLTVLDRSFCERQGIPYLKEHPRTGGNLAYFPAFLDQLSFGGIVVSGVVANVTDLPAELKVAGILSLQDAFKGLLVELDGRALALSVYRDLDEAGWRDLAGELTHVEPLQWSDGRLFARGRLGREVAGLFQLDLGAGASMVSPRVAHRLGHRLLAPAQGEPPRVAARFALGDEVRARREELAIVEDPVAPAAGGPEALGTIGFGWAIGRRLALAPDGTRLLFTEARGP